METPAVETPEVETEVQAEARGLSDTEAALGAAVLAEAAVEDEAPPEPDGVE